MSSYFWLNINPRKKCRKKAHLRRHRYESLMTSSDNQGKGERYDWLWMNMSSHVFHQTHAATQLWRHTIMTSRGKMDNCTEILKAAKCEISMSTFDFLCPKIFQIKHPKALGRIYFSTSNLHLRPLDPKNKIKNFDRVTFENRVCSKISMWLSTYEFRLCWL